MTHWAKNIAQSGYSGSGASHATKIVLALPSFGKLGSGKKFAPTFNRTKFNFAQICETIDPTKVVFIIVSLVYTILQVSSKPWTQNGSKNLSCQKIFVKSDKYICKQCKLQIAIFCKPIFVSFSRIGARRQFSTYATV
jgi:hypothetical protein